MIRERNLESPGQIACSRTGPAPKKSRPVRKPASSSRVTPLRHQSDHPVRRLPRARIWNFFRFFECLKSSSPAPSPAFPRKSTISPPFTPTSTYMRYPSAHAPVLLGLTNFSFAVNNSSQISSASPSPHQLHTLPALTRLPPVPVRTAPRTYITPQTVQVLALSPITNFSLDVNAFRNLPSAPKTLSLCPLCLPLLCPPCNSLSPTWHLAFGHLAFPSHFYLAFGQSPTYFPASRRLGARAYAL